MPPGPDTKAPRVSLVMPNRDNAPVLDLVLDRLAENTTYPDVELVVVDDGSTDGSLEILGAGATPAGSRSSGCSSASTAVWWRP